MKGDIGIEQAWQKTSGNFLRFASSDSARSGEEYLGYRGRATVVEQLTKVFHNVSQTNVQPKGRDRTKSSQFVLYSFAEVDLEHHAYRNTRYCKLLSIHSIEKRISFNSISTMRY